MANNHRTIGNVSRGVWNRICLGIARHLFPAQVRNVFYRMAGVKIGKGSKIGATVDIDQSAPELITIASSLKGKDYREIAREHSALVEFTGEELMRVIG